MNHDTPIDVAAMLTEVGVDATTADPAVSVGESSILRSERSVEMLPQHQPPAVEITLDSKIGEGETSEVWLGTQKSMRRTVAVRRVHPIRHTAAAPGYILSEAWMLGAFEHPNILPVYAVAKDERGLPLVLMKAIETVPWTEVLESDGHPLGCPQHTDPLEFDVRRIIAVCSALEHAHHRGKIHRDVKPDHVLIGRDGTVYLHGWDLAVALEEDPTGRFATAASQTQIAGTPAYMAPELARNDAAAIGLTTDVYLVGATLHEVVTGEPRHLGENVFDAFYSAVASEPVDYDPERVPHELALILNKAMAADPADRFASMVELRHALESFLRHRPSYRLTEHAVQAHGVFTAALHEEADDFIVRELFASAFTAYGSARNFWSRNPVVRQGLERAIREMIGYELDRGSSDRALDLLGRLSTPDPELERRIRQVEAHPTVPRIGDADTRTRTKKIERPLPLETAVERQSRRVLMASMVIIWASFGFAFAVVDSLDAVEVTNLTMAIVAMVGWLVLAGIAVAKSRALFKSATARNFVGPIGVVLAGSAALLIALGRTATPQELVAAHFMVFFVAMGMLTAMFELRLILSSATYFLAFVIASLAPASAFWVMGLANLIGLGYAGYIIDRRLEGV